MLAFRTGELVYQLMDRDQDGKISEAEYAYGRPGAVVGDRVPQRGDRGAQPVPGLLLGAPATAATIDQRGGTGRADRARAATVTGVRTGQLVAVEAGGTQRNQDRVGLPWPDLPAWLRPLALGAAPNADHVASRPRRVGS